MKTESGRFPTHSRHAALLLPLCVILLTALCGTWAHATDVPFTARTISTTVITPRSVFAADVDGDGDMDVLSASTYDGKIAWYENKGGQFALPTTDTGPSRMFNSDTSDRLKVVATHNGRTGDTDMELVTLELLFEETQGDPLTSGEANALIENLYIYLDDGSGTFDPASDTLVTTMATLVLTAGTQTVAFADADPNVQVLYGTPETYFVVVELTADAGSQTPNSFMVTHVTETTSTAEDRDNDIPLSLEYAANVSSTVVVLSALPPSFKVDDQFGQTVLSVSSDGDLFLTGNVTANAGSISATTGSEVLVKDIGGQIAALIDVATGNLSLRGSVTTGQTSLSNPSSADLVFKNIGGQVVGYITAAGDMVLAGDIHNEFPFN